MQSTVGILLLVVVAGSVDAWQTGDILVQRTNSTYSVLSTGAATVGVARMSNISLPTLPDRAAVLYKPVTGGVGAQVYLIGGYNKGAIDQVDVFDPTMNTFTSGPSLPTPRRQLSATVGKYAIHVCGGMDADGNPALECYTNYGHPVWVVEKPLPTPRPGASLVGVGSHLLCIGGGTAEILWKNVDVFGANWTSAFNLTTGPLSKQAAVRVDDNNVLVCASMSCFVLNVDAVGVFTVTKAMPLLKPRADATLVQAAPGVVYIIGDSAAQAKTVDKLAYGSVDSLPTTAWVSTAVELSTTTPHAVPMFLSF